MLNSVNSVNDVNNEHLWHVIVADDDSEVHEITRLVLSGMEFEGREIDLLFAHNEHETRALLDSCGSAALILLDVVMDSDSTGLDLVHYIRKVKKNRFIRIILRTGQPGMAPEHRVISEYDINDYRDKTELTSQKLKTSVLSALRSYRDLRQLEKSRMDLINSRCFLESIISSISSVMIVVDSDMRVHEWNKAAQALFLKARDRAMGRDLFELVPDLRVYHQVMLESLTDYAAGARMDVQLILKAEERTFNTVCFPLHYGQMEGLILLMDDVTGLRKLDLQLRRGQKMEALGTLAAGLAHDINNALGGITGALSLIDFELERQPELHNPEYDEYLSTISHSADRAGLMVRQLLNLSRKEELFREEVDLVKVLSHVANICRASFDKRITIIWNPELESAVILAEASQLEQVVLNLSINAYHAMTSMRPSEESWHGTLTYTLERIQRKDADTFQISVNDTGVGIDASLHEKIFDPFFTTREHGAGAGLGLAIVHNIVKLSGGTIDLESGKGKGTSFILEFEAAEKTAHLREEDHRDRLFQNLTGSGTVLLCDDEPLMRKVASKILIKAGYRVITVDDGYQAVGKYREDPQGISVVILDCQMPGLNGTEAFRQMQEICPDVKVLLSSGYRHEPTIEQAMNNGAKGFLQKPYTMSELADTLKNILAENS